MEGPSPSLVVGIDVGMTCTDVAYTTSADWKKPEDIQDWPGRKDPKSFFTKGKVFSMVWHEKSVTSTHRSRNFLPILVNGTRTNALPDTGSLANVITEEYASSQGVFIDRHPSKQQVFINAVGNTFKSVGQATVQLSFLDMPGKVFSEVFSVVSKCGTPLVLGDSFLQTQEILTRFRHRLKKIAVTAKQAWRLMHMDIPYQKFICRMDDQYVAVTVDTGSEKNYFSRNYAQRCCWDIKPLPSDGGFVELADGQIVKASGYIDKEISIGAYECKGRFYILDGLMCDALLGDETIEESDLYNDANIRNWVVSETSDIHSEFFAISWLDKIEDHVSEFLNDPSYQIPDQMQDLLDEVHRQNTSYISPSPMGKRRWWDPRRRSQSRQQKRVNEQCQLLLSGVWIKLGKLDNAELEAREAAKQAMTQATGDDLRRIQSANDARQQQHIDQRACLLELRAKLLEWKASKTSQTP